jgi:hypothetical protein
MTENVFSGRISYGGLFQIDEKQVSINFQLTHGKNNFVGSYEFNPHKEIYEKIEFFNNDLKKIYRKFDDKRQSRFRGKIFNFLANEYPSAWEQIQEGKEVLKAQEIEAANALKVSPEDQQNAVEQDLPIFEQDGSEESSDGSDES